MFALLLLAVVLALQQVALAYEVTEYYEETVSILGTVTFNGRTSTRVVTNTVPVLVTARVTASLITAATSTVPGGQVTVVSALVPPGVLPKLGKEESSMVDNIEYFVPLTYAPCSTLVAPSSVSLETVTPVTTYARVYLPSEVQRYIVPTYINTTYRSLQGQYATSTGLQGWLDPKAINPADLARISYNAQPSRTTVCRRQTAAVDYSAVCSSVSAFGGSSENPVLLPTPKAGQLDCGAKNPCC
jgi:hypothetical protein